MGIHSYYQRLPSGPLATRIIVLEAASIVRPSKERAISASSSSDIAKVTRPTEDFLFGNDKGLIIIKRYRHALNLARWDSDDISDDDDDDDNNNYRRKNNVVTSQLPLGGGAVLPPSRTPDRH